VSLPLAYFITFTTYGTWLQGRDPGWVDRKHNQYGDPIPAADADRETRQRAKMNQPEYLLNQPRRATVLQTIADVAQVRNWQLWAVHVRTNHVHIVVSAPQRPEKIMGDFKAWCSRRIREQFSEPSERERWTRHGSTKYLWSAEQIQEKVAYVVEGQGTRLEYFDYRSATQNHS
jgi:REP element-mobilizing transposase RayT